MRYQPLAFAALTVSSVCALPSVIKRDDATWDPNGNVKLTFSKDTVKLGDVSIDDMFDKLAGVCHESGQCETNDITLDGWWIEAGPNGDMEPITVTMGPDGAYPTWIRNGLLDTLKAAVKQGAKCGDVTNTQLCQGGDKGCSPTKTTAYQCEVPAFWGINYQDPNAANAAPPNIGVDVTMANTDSTACADMMTALGAVAGAVNGAAGGIFTLLSLTCQ